MDIQQYWDKAHDKYAATDWIDKPSLFAEWALQYLPHGGALLDLGAGQAQDSCFFAGKGFDVIATDLSAHALDLAKAKFLAAEFQVVNMAMPLPYSDEQFEVVYAHLSVHYFDSSQTHKLFAEIRRVLKPGGVFAALCNSDQDPEISEGQEIEPNYIEIDGITKRYFNPNDAKEFTKEFEIVVADDQGTTYKDEAKGVHNLVRLVAMKPA
ncbi:class I SAM-dependent methyltransferase [Aeromicrobium sp.]|nr:class I SAM-dependent methyltransferase [Candidatus Saccharibacteria bacterium]